MIPSTVSSEIELPERGAAPVASNQQATLAEHVRNALTRYMEELDGHHPSNLYQMVIEEVERPLLEIVMNHVGGNQTRAARCLGINRATLRKKLALYGINQ